MDLGIAAHLVMAKNRMADDDCGGAEIIRSHAAEDGDAQSRHDADRSARASGMPLSGSPAPMGKRGQLNPNMSRWLMGYPVQWCQCATRVIKPQAREAMNASEAEAHSIPANANIVRATLLRTRFKSGVLEDLTAFSRRVFCNRACMAAWMEGQIKRPSVKAGHRQSSKHVKAACEMCQRTGTRLYVHHRDEEPVEQCPIELTDVVRLLPSSLDIRGELHGDHATAEALRLVRQTRGAERLLQYPSDQIQAVWRSLTEEDQDIFRLAIGQSGLVRTIEHPLAHGAPARVGRLRGYGNAIVPQVAQVFIEAYLEATC